MFKMISFLVFIVSLAVLIIVLLRLDRRFKKLDKEIPPDVEIAPDDKSIEHANPPDIKAEEENFAKPTEDVAVKVIRGDREPEEYLKEHAPKPEKARIHIRSKDGVYALVVGGKSLTELLNAVTREGAFDSYLPTIALKDRVDRLWMQDLICRRGIWMPLLAQNGILGNNSVQVFVEEEEDEVIWRKFSYHNDPEAEIEMPETHFDKKQYKTFQDTFKLYSGREK